MTYHNIITEWHATTPSANVFEGTRRELLREAHVVAESHAPDGRRGVQPHGEARRPGLRTALHQRQRSRIQQRRGTQLKQPRPDSTPRLHHDRHPPLRSTQSEGNWRAKGLGDYTIPMANKFASDGDPKTLGEIYAYGFRNAHRLSWDTDGTMFASDIGMNHVEEINIVRNGENYGWMKREGYWENGRSRGGELNQLFPLPADVLNGRQKDGFTYPVAIFDHDEGRAVTDGFAYRGRIAALRNKFVFGDIASGRLFAADLAELKKADDGVPQTVAPIEEIQFFVRDASGNRMDVSLQELVNRTMGASVSRADLHISRTGDGELLITSRQDGMIRVLVPETNPSGPAPATR